MRVTSAEAAAYASSTEQSTNNNEHENGGGQKRALQSEEEDILRSSEGTKKRHRTDGFVFDLSDVPPQQPILKSAGRIKEGASKYTGVYFNKEKMKWQSQIMIDGKIRHIGYYENEEEAAIDFARAVFKYKGRETLAKALHKKIKRNSSGPGIVIDLTDVPPQTPILKSVGHVKKGSSKYTGISFNKASNKWTAQIMIDRHVRFIGLYENEEEAAIDYARALYKYKGQEALHKARERYSTGLAIDLEDVPTQPPILKSEGCIKEGASKYTGVSFSKANNKWHAAIRVEGKKRHIGYYENEEEAAIDYARAAFKCKGQGAVDKAIEGKQRHVGCYENEEKAGIDHARVAVKYRGEGNSVDKARERKPSTISINLSDVPPQLPIPKSKGYIKEGASKYTGVSFNKKAKKWHAQIMIEGKIRSIGHYKIEEEAATDYARAVLKYKGQEALDKARGQNSPVPAIGLRDVPPQLPILKSTGRTKTGSSKYTGVFFHKASNKWEATITIDGKSRYIGRYENEEDAAVDYARAVFKFKGQDALDIAREQDSDKAPG